VFHLAALIGIPYSYHAPHSYVEPTCTARSTSAAALEAGGPRRPHVDERSVRHGAVRPIDEKHLCSRSRRTRTKIGATAWPELLRSFGLPVATSVLQYFGPRQSARAVIRRSCPIAQRAETLTVGSLAPVRDFTYVKTWYGIPVDRRVRRDGW